MSFIRFTINEIAKREVEIPYKLAGLANKAAHVGYNIAVQKLKESLYRISRLNKADLTNDSDLQLSLDGRPSDHFAASNAIKRNNIILKTYLDFTNGTHEIQIELIDVKIKVTQQNTIVSTALVGRRGSVKEYIQAKDYAINIKGSVFSNSQNAFPVEDVVLLKQILGLPSRIKVYSEYLELFGITQMVFKTGAYDQQETKFANQLIFNFDFESDDDYDLTVI